MIDRASRLDWINPARSRWLRWNDIFEDEAPIASPTAPAGIPSGPAMTRRRTIRSRVSWESDAKASEGLHFVHDYLNISIDVEIRIYDMNTITSPSIIDFQGDGSLRACSESLGSARRQISRPRIRRRTIQQGYHVTEVKAGSFVTLDCGGNPDQWHETILQVEDLPSARRSRFHDR